MSLPQMLIFETDEALATAAAVYVRQVAERAVSERGRFLLVLSGGSTPQPLFSLLASSPYRDTIPWAQTHLFWSDERTVPPDHEESNYGVARQLLLRHVPIPDEQVHRIVGEYEPAAAAQAYEEALLRQAEDGMAWPRFDLVLLGLGTDCHTASLFPGSTYPMREAQPVLTVTASYDDRPAGRITLTPPAINSARNICFLVSGAAKADAVAATLEGPRNLVECPAQRIQPSDGSLIWFVDRAAAAKLDVANNEE